MAAADAGSCHGLQHVPEERRDDLMRKSWPENADATSDWLEKVSKIGEVHGASLRHHWMREKQALGVDRFYDDQ